MRSPAHKQVIDMAKNFMVDAAVEQAVDTPTRVVITEDAVSNSTLDHVYLSCPNSYSKPLVTPVGDSDHWGQVVSQLSTKLPN